MLRRHLSRIGHQVSVTQNLNDAKGMLDEDPTIDVFIIDLHLNDYKNDSGLTFLHEVAEKKPSSFRILFSGFPDPPSSSVQELQPWHYYFKKPFDVQELIRLLEQQN